MMNNDKLLLFFTILSLANVIANLLNYFARDRGDCAAYFYAGISTGLFVALLAVFVASIAATKRTEDVTC